MIDSHCHLNYIKGESPEKLVEAAAGVGVEMIINIGTDLESSEKSVEYTEQFNSVYATVGVHPHDAKDVNEQTLANLKNLAANEKVVAIGEIGLDYYRDHSPRDVQRKVFKQQLEIAVDLRLPVVIHTRDAHNELIEIIKDYASDLPGGVFHCFQGDYDDAMEVVELGFLISVGGVITYKNSQMSKTAQQVPLDRIILETDAPFLTPVPFRGKTNKPEMVVFVYKELARLKKLPFEQVEKTIDLNTKKLFGLVETFGD